MVIMRFRLLPGIILILLIVVLIVSYFFTKSNEAFLPEKKPPIVRQHNPISTTSAAMNMPDKIKLPIITYHYVENVQDPGDTTRIKLAISPFLFENQLKLLKEASYSSYFVKDIPQILQGKEKLQDKSIVLTFDDGYKDIYTDAFPLLKKYQIKGTLFIVANFIGRQGFMTQNEIQEMLQSGLIEVGAHSLSHPNLVSLPLVKARQQIFDSKKILEDMFNIQVKTFAYPGGSFNDDVINLVKEASYEAAVTTKPGVYSTRDKLLTLPRLRSGYLFLRTIQLFFDKFIQ